MKKLLATICALMLMTSFVSCGDTQENSSESSSSISESTTKEVTTEELTESETTTIETTTSKPKYVLPELYETYEFDGMSFKISSDWEQCIEQNYNKKIVTLSVNPETTFEVTSLSVSPHLSSKEFAEKELKENADKSEYRKYEKVLINDIYWVRVNYINGHHRENAVEFECQNGNKKYEFNFFYDSKENIDEDMMSSILSTIGFDSIYDENTTSTTKSVAVKTEPPTEKPISTPIKETEPPTNPPVIVQKEEKTVYYTETGSKYHYDSKCGRGEYFPCTLDEALDMGLEPCKKCT